MKIIPDESFVVGHRVEFDLPIGAMTAVHRALLLAALLDAVSFGAPNCDGLFEALARAEDSVRSARAEAWKGVNRGQN